MMKTKSAKAKGRRLQNWMKEKLIQTFNLKDEDVRTAVMGEAGADVVLAPSVRSLFPYNIECKNVERLNIWKAWEQACREERGNLKAILVVSKNRHTPLVVCDAKHFIQLHKKEK